MSPRSIRLSPWSVRPSPPGVTHGRGVAVGPLAGPAAEDAALRHLQAGGDGGDAGQRGGQAGDVGLHVAQQLLQLVQHCGESAAAPRYSGLTQPLLSRYSLLTQGLLIA